ncbi:MAG: hypothetical protein A3H98_06320 [Bacteroidetes bacterium RIFCSPLOWO2_02_FULL_36_8]|nr:MAG: hypothetical protein A3H98_06320 [Bacteroidetes bacterium RIFCSPLOWO2_02_FULL_36_8]OFY71203.1 MAG: hypothetical protein A3G23_10525 [Bacteroidetes bacterium RIFCSPLOWO2_12_FULL_37_12]
MELVQADELQGDVIKGEPVRILNGNVIFRNGTTLIYCHRAFQFTNPTRMEMFGRVRIVEENKSTVESDSLFYDNNTKIARLRKNVVATDNKMSLKTNFLDYSMETGDSYYYNNGKMVDDKNTLTSISGFYNAGIKIITFKKEVLLQSENKRLTADSLKYNYQTKTLFFTGPTKIYQDDIIIHTTSGNYSTETENTRFEKRTTIEDSDYKLTGDTLYWDKSTETGKAFGNIQLTSKNEDITVDGQRGIYNRIQKSSKVWGDAVIKQLLDSDTVCIRADTLLSLQDSLNYKIVIAFKHATIFKPDLQGKCDSLVYISRDSLMKMFSDPVMWAQSSQMSGKFIQAHIVNNKLDYVDIKDNSYMISQDELNNFNQVKGKSVHAVFKEGKIEKMLVNGNAQSIYYIIDDSKKRKKNKGINYSLSSDMVLYYKKNKVKNISFLTKPEARFIPLHEIKEEDTRFKDFNWRIGEKPVK